MSDGGDSAVETFCRNVSPADRTQPAVTLGGESDRFRGYRTTSTRLQGWDYAGDGAYFVTICTRNREQWLSQVVNGRADLTPVGKIVEEEWQTTARLRPYVEIDHFIVMPNHLHAILGIRGRHPRIRNEQPNAAARETSRQDVSTAAGPRLLSGSLGAIVGQFKSACVKRIRQIEPDFGWQANYYDHIIRDVDDLDRIRDYIIENPAKWDLTEDVPENLWM